MEMNLPMFQGFSKSLMMTVLSEVGDRTFCVAAILAMRHPRSSVLFGCVTSVILTTTLSAVIGWAAPNLIPRELAHHITTLLFFGFGLWSLWEAYNEDDDDNEELEQVEKELNEDAAPKDTTSRGPKQKESSKADEDLKKQRKPFLTNFFSPVFIKAFSVTFFGEWGDKSQLATIGLAADENATGVILGGILAQVLCTVAAVTGGKSLASKISERLVTMASGVLFLIFGVQSFLSTIY